MTFVVSVDFQIAADSPLSHHLKTPAMAAYTWNLQFQRQHFFKTVHTVSRREYYYVENSIWPVEKFSPKDKSLSLLCESMCGSKEGGGGAGGPDPSPEKSQKYRVS